MYISNLQQYKDILPYIKNETTWLSVNPKKKCYLNYSDKIIKAYSGKDIGVKSINNIFIDIDPIDKKFEDRIERLKKMYEFVKILLKDLESQNIVNYSVLCSGYGWQILIKLDIPLILPEQIWDEKSSAYITTENFENYKMLIKKVFYSRLLKKYGNLAKEYDCEIDKSGCNIGRVFCGIMTNNVKYGKIVKRSIMILKNEKENNGLSDWLIDEIDSVKKDLKYTKNYVKELPGYFKLTERTLMKNELVNWILNNDLPSGMCNNYLIFSLKNLIKDNGIDFNSKEVKKLKTLIDNKWNANISWNVPEKSHFNSNIVNNFCIYNKLPLLYKFYNEYNPTRPRNINKQIFSYDNYEKYPLKDLTVKLDGSSIVERINELRKILINIDNNDLFVQKLYSGLYYMEMEGDDVKYILEEVCPYYMNTILLNKKI